LYVERVEYIEDLLVIQCEHVRAQCVLIGYLERDLKLAHVKNFPTHWTRVIPLLFPSLDARAMKSVPASDG
jgi:hypothetical protein